MAFSYPIFGPTINCPHCRQPIAALTLTDTYLCHRHGAFEANPKTGELVHLQSGRCWRLWQGRWFRQHTHADGIRFEIHEELDRLRTQGMRATHVIIAERYRELLSPYLDPDLPRRQGHSYPRLYGLPVSFSPRSPMEDLPSSTNPASRAMITSTISDPNHIFELEGRDPEEIARWQVINFELVHEKDPNLRRSRFQTCE